MSKQTYTSITLGSISGASGVSTLADCDGYKDGKFIFNVSALGAGTTLVITVQESNNGTAWATHTATSGITSTGIYGLSCVNLARYVRLSWTLSGGTTTATVAASVGLNI